MARLKVLDQERAALKQGVPLNRDLVEALERLAYAYEALGREATPLDSSSRKQPKGKRRAAVASAAAFTAGAADTSTSSSSSDSSSTWDSSYASDSSSPSSDGGSW